MSNNPIFLVGPLRLVENMSLRVPQAGTKEGQVWSKGLWSPFPSLPHSSSGRGGEMGTEDTEQQTFIRIPSDLPVNLRSVSWSPLESSNWGPEGWNDLSKDHIHKAHESSWKVSLNSLKSSAKCFVCISVPLTDSQLRATHLSWGLSDSKACALRLTTLDTG